MLEPLYPKLASYNTLMNQKCCEAATKLSSEALNQDRGAYFKSIKGTLEHIVIADVLWLRRFESTKPKADYWKLLNSFGQLSQLNQALFQTFEELRKARIEVDALIETWVGELEMKRIEDEFHFSDMAGQPHKLPLWFCLTHFFNHQTHHRGQVSTLFMQEGIDIGVTDFPRIVPAPS